MATETREKCVGIRRLKRSSQQSRERWSKKTKYELSSVSDEATRQECMPLTSTLKQLGYDYSNWRQSVGSVYAWNPGILPEYVGPSLGPSIPTCEKIKRQRQSYSPEVPEIDARYFHSTPAIACDGCCNRETASRASTPVTLTDANNNIIDQLDYKLLVASGDCTDHVIAISEDDLATHTTNNDSFCTVPSIATHENTPTVNIRLNEGVGDQEEQLGSILTENVLHSNESRSASLHKYKRLCYCLLIGAILIFALLLAGGASAFFIWVMLNGGGIFILEGAVRSYISKVETINVVVKSLREYENSSPIHSNNVEYIITFNLINVEKWPNKFNLHNADRIVEIQVIGYFDEEALLKVLAQATKLKRLYLRNIEGKLCLNEKTEHKASLVLSDRLGPSSLAHLTLDAFGPSCTGLYHTLNNLVRMNALEHFSLISSVINEHNAGIIQNILRDSRYSLSSIEFINTNLSTAFFKWSNIGVMPNMTNMIFDIWKDSNVANYFDGNHFAKELPNLRRFSFGTQMRSLNQSKAVYGLNKLRELDMAICMPLGVSNYSVGFLHTEFPQLENATINLTFKACDNTYQGGKKIHKNYILDLDMLPEPLLSKLIINASCPFMTGHEDYV